ncbi:MAG: hypothetical protein MUC95_06115, partial [Spirochaetes bacterium]|nr:hypothetical protein [Spirochaetota bacterium]
MAEALVCKVCNKKESSDKCSVCGIALCDGCKHVIQTEDMSASHRVKGMTTEGVLGPSQKKRVVCPKCMAETDFLGKDDHHDDAEKGKVFEIRKDRLKKLRKPKKGSVTHLVGDYKVDLTHLTPDIRGREELVREILDKNYIETRVKQYDTKIKPYSRVEDISEWDRILLDRYRPIYTQDGDCAKKKKKKKDNVKLALKTLEEHIKGTSKAIAMARTVLDEAIRAFGADKKVNLGESILFVAPNACVLTGFDPQDLAGLNKALEYAESQLVEQVSVLASGAGDAVDLEQRALHLGSIYIIATEIEEVVKICCFDALSVGNMAVKDFPNFPPVQTPVGMGTIDRSKPVLAFFGDDSLPIIFTIGCLEEEGIIKDIEVCGLGNAGHRHQ